VSIVAPIPGHYHYTYNTDLFLHSRTSLALVKTYTMMVLPSPSLGASSTQHNIYTAHTIAQKSTDKYLVGARGSSKAEDQISAKKYSRRT
jgi:hypothetical protein